MQQIKEKCHDIFLYDNFQSNTALMSRKSTQPDDTKLLNDEDACSVTSTYPLTFDCSFCY